MEKSLLPISQHDMKKRGWDALDFILVSGDAYVDHPSFGVAVIGRVLESRGYRVGVIAQPSWRTLHDFKRLGEPRLGFLVSSGNIDSMVNHYTVAKNRRKSDAYAPGGKTGQRPNRATIVYAHKIREAFKHTPIILGGIEASLRRLAHYDYWDDKVRRSLLLDAKADLLVYGMGENAIVEIAEALKSGIHIDHIAWVRGTVYKTTTLNSVHEPLYLPRYEDICSSKRKFAESFMCQYHNIDAQRAKPLVEPYSGNMYVVQNPPSLPLTTQELDDVYALPYTKQYHPSYEAAGGVPALQEVKFSLLSSRGCFGGCNFCALSFHQGRTVQARSIDAIVDEARDLIQDPKFKGYIHDVGGPTANFRNRACQRQLERGVCTDRQCLFPKPCPHLEADHSEYVELLRQLRQLPHVKQVFVRSGIRYDYLLHDKDPTFLEMLCEYHVGGQLKVAPEHVSAKVLAKMGKPRREVYEKFVQRFEKISRRLNKEQFIIPYLISSHPGSDLEAAIELAEYLRDLGFIPEQVQDFYPTPGTMSTCMYYTELDPKDMSPVYVPKSPHEKAMQRALVQYNKPNNYDLVYEALSIAGRTDLIGYDKKCLIRPRQGKNTGRRKKKPMVNKKP